MINQNVTFSAQSSNDSDGTIVSYEWDMDNDGIFDFSGMEIIHSWQNNGTYQIGLIVTDNDGLTDMIHKNITISSNPPGDVNGDGNLNPADVRYLALFICGEPNYQPLHVDGNVNSNGVVNSADVCYLALYLCGHPDYSPLYL